MTLQNEIMNIQIDEKELRANLPAASFAAYKVGHRDARHAAAELSLRNEEVMDLIEEAIKLIGVSTVINPIEKLKKALEILK